MFGRILIPTDGSNEADAAGRQAIELAKSLGASVVALHVAPPFQTQYLEDFAPPPETTRDMWHAGMRTVAERHFQPLRDAARAAGVPFHTDVAFDKRPADAIGVAAKTHGCDLIVIILAKAKSTVQDAGLGAETLLLDTLTGRVCDLVVDQAGKRHADLIVLGDPRAAWRQPAADRQRCRTDRARGAGAGPAGARGGDLDLSWRRKWRWREPPGVRGVSLRRPLTSLG